MIFVYMPILSRSFYQKMYLVQLTCIKITWNSSLELLSTRGRTGAKGQQTDYKQTCMKLKFVTKSICVLKTTLLKFKMYKQTFYFHIEPSIKPINLIDFKTFLKHPNIFQGQESTEYATSTRFHAPISNWSESKNTIFIIFYGSKSNSGSCDITFPWLLARSGLGLPALMFRLSTTTRFWLWILKMPNLLYQMLLCLSSVVESNGPTTTWSLGTWKSASMPPVVPF